MTSNSHTEKDAAEIALTKALQSIYGMPSEPPQPCKGETTGGYNSRLAMYFAGQFGAARMIARGALRDHLISTPDMPKGEEA